MLKKYSNVRKHRLINDNPDFLDLPSYITLDEVNDYLDDYHRMKNYVLDTYNKFRNFEDLKLLPLDDIEDFVSKFTTIRSSKQDDIAKYSKLIYSDDDWDVYKVFGYPAARELGRGTRWCIAGRYEGHEERGEEYFNLYIETRKLDGGYYFYISPDGKKYCVLKRKDGTIDTIWLPNDYRVQSSKILSIRPDFPSVPGVFDFNNFNKVTDNEKEVLLASAAKKCMTDLRDRFKSYYDKCSFSKPSIGGDVIKFNFNVTLFFSSAKVKGTVTLTYKSPVAFDFNYSFIDTKKLLNDGKGFSGTINDVAVFENSAEGEDEILYEDFYNALTDADDAL